jgi:hypothetical protein
MNQTKVEKYLPALVGKTIERICYIEAENQKDGYSQVIFEFSDGSNFEIYGKDMHFIKGVRLGGIEAVTQGLKNENILHEHSLSAV